MVIRAHEARSSNPLVESEFQASINLIRCSLANFNFRCIVLLLDDDEVEKGRPVAVVVLVVLLRSMCSDNSATVTGSSPRVYTR